MPGLVEAHSHLSYFNAASLQDLDLNCAVESTTIKAVLNARILLDHGYTSACRAGSTGRCNGPAMMAGSPRSPDQWSTQHARRAVVVGGTRSD